MIKDNQYNAVSWTEQKPEGGVALTHWCLYNKILEYVKPNNVALDVGCGFGGGSSLLSKKCSKVVGVEPDHGHILWAKEHNQKHNIEFIESHIEDYETWVKFDFICMIAVIEHVTDAGVVIKKCVNMLKPDGIFLVYWSDANVDRKEIEEILKGYDYDLIVISKDIIKESAWFTIIRCKK